MQNGDTAPIITGFLPLQKSRGRCGDGVFNGGGGGVVKLWWGGEDAGVVEA